MDSLTDKVQWDVKVFDESILAKWKIEAMNMPGRLISETAWTWIVKELRWKAANYWRTGYLTTLETCSTIVKRDRLIGESIRRELQEALKPLVEISEEEKYWHPESNQKALNLVHPRIDDCLLGMSDDGVIIDIPQAPVQQTNFEYEDRFPYPELWSTRFQWLPCDAEFKGPSGNEVLIVSYINNLYPAKSRDLYHVIEKVIRKSIQPWNEVLSWKNSNDYPLRIYYQGQIKYTKKSLQVEKDMHDIQGDMYDVEMEDIEGQAKVLERAKQFLAQPDDPDRITPLRARGHSRGSFDPSDLADWRNVRSLLADELSTKWERSRVTDHPEPDDEKNFGLWKEARQKRLRPEIQEMFRERGLQVIVKLSSIELTPDKPEYDGGSWHLEGKMNEHIVATSIYYYDVDNVTVPVSTGSTTRFHVRGLLR